MINLLRVNGAWLPTPEGDLQFTDAKVKKEKETEAGTTQVIVTRNSKITITGKWTLSGKWAARFRELKNEDTVLVDCYYPDPNDLTTHECQFVIAKETHVNGARLQLPGTGGVYQVEVTIEEI